MNNRFSENIKRIRKDYNLSQEQLAEELGVSRQAISKWESSTAYPEMDKIIALCDKFNLNIDDLLNKDIKEVKNEKESKKKLNKLMDDILKFITDSINLFISMNFKSKIKCLFEQGIIILFLFIISKIITQLFSTFFTSILSFLPLKINNIITSYLNSIIILFCFISSIIILLNTFKTRYLDYYNKLKDRLNKDKIDNNKDNIQLKDNENKVIIRDPKHSEYRFISMLYRLIILIIKFFALCFSVNLCFILIFLFVLFVGTFLVYKTGLLFIGLFCTILSSSVITIILLIVILNFVFNRKNSVKKLIFVFITSIITLGIGCGLIFVGILNFEVLETNETMLKKNQLELDMNDNIFFNFYSKNIEYVESDIDNIKLEYEINKYCELEPLYISGDSGVHIWASCNNPTKLIKIFIENINNKKLIPITNEIESVKVFATKENIDKIKNNEKNYFERGYNENIVEADEENFEDKFFDLEVQDEIYND